MKSYLAKVVVTLKPSILDPQGVAVRTGLLSMGYSDVDHAHDDRIVLFTLHQQDTDLSVPPPYAGQINAARDCGLRHLL